MYRILVVDDEKIERRESSTFLRKIKKRKKQYLKHLTESRH